MRRVSAALCLALVALGGCVSSSPRAGSRRSLPLAHDGQIVVVTSGESRFSVMHEGNVQLDPTLDDVLRWVPYGALWRAVAQLAVSGVNELSEAERRAATAPHVRGLAPRTVVAEAFARALVGSGGIREVRTLDREPLGADRRGAVAIVRLAVPRWGLLRVLEGKPDLVAAFADVSAQAVVPETGAVLWEHEEDVTHPDRLPLDAFTRDRQFTRQGIVDVLERAGRRLAAEYLYAKMPGR
jgi:hypothetical protein